MFYQHNPYEASSLWGNISWGHAVSTDLAHWARLEPPPLQPSMPYDRNGIYSGSVTLRADGSPALFYTCVRRVPAEGYEDEALCAAGHRGPECVEDQQQCLALPVQAPGASPDPLLRRWEKFERNPVVRAPPPGGDRSQFRDPATAWRERSGPRGEGSWVTVVGGMVEGRGTAILYVSATPVPWAGCRSWPHTGSHSPAV